MTTKQMMQALQLLHGIVEQVELNGLSRDQARDATKTIQQAFLEFQQLQEEVNKIRTEFSKENKQTLKNSQQDDSTE